MSFSALLTCRLKQQVIFRLTKELAEHFVVLVLGWKWVSNLRMQPFPALLFAEGSLPPSQLPQIFRGPLIGAHSRCIRSRVRIGFERKLSDPTVIHEQCSPHSNLMR